MEKGVDPSFFSKVLMESCCRVAARESVDLMKPVQILSRALDEVRSVHSKCYGKTSILHGNATVRYVVQLCMCMKSCKIHIGCSIHSRANLLPFLK